ncbi:hypothetical protein KIPB_004555 [Kipferlia bialata]|uniref:DNA mismatch repair proteins mutS family domain-containing protein n=1 Tax=Kipferlia bialata TaxID=797122 RepID=A0A9K3GHW1_9EUKA|nr:hypothetical protein KIPB_004555 [Kipferlia bialata]|eukprot:g4555.t1
MTEKIEVSFCYDTPNHFTAMATANRVDPTVVVVPSTSESLLTCAVAELELEPVALSPSSFHPSPLPASCPEPPAKGLSKAAASALSGLLSYLSGKGVSHTSVSMSATSAHCLVSRDCALALELVNGRGSLFQLLDHCRTAAGKSLLRASILGPSVDAGTIEDRLDALEEILSDMSLFTRLSDSVPSCAPPAVLLSRVQKGARGTPAAAGQALRALISLHHALRGCVTLSTILLGPGPSVLDDGMDRDTVGGTLSPGGTVPPEETVGAQTGGCRSRLLRTMGELLSEPCHAALEALDEVLEVAPTPEVSDYDPEPSGPNPTAKAEYIGSAVKRGVSGLLDVARATEGEALQDLQGLLARYRMEHNLPRLQLGRQRGRGWYLYLPCRSVQEGRRVGVGLPEIFTRVATHKRRVTFSSNELSSLSSTHEASQREVVSMAARVLGDTMQLVTVHSLAIRETFNALARLDLVLSLAHYCTLVHGPLTRPCVSAYDASATTPSSYPLAIKGARHPVLDRAGTVVDNDVFIGSDNRVVIVSGENLAGKTTYLRTVGQLVILAQMGCLVPAKYCAIPVRSCLVAAFNSDQPGEYSAFSTECRAANRALQSASQGSLVLVDELGRGTSPSEGSAICQAYIEHLVSTSSMALMVTHLPRVISLPLTLQVSSVCIKDKRVDQRGGGMGDMYGIKAAMYTGWPQDVIQDATAIRRTMTDGDRGSSLFRLGETLIALSRNRMVTGREGAGRGGIETGAGTGPQMMPSRVLDILKAYKKKNSKARPQQQGAVSHGQSGVSSTPQVPPTHSLYTTGADRERQRERDTSTSIRAVAPRPTPTHTNLQSVYNQRVGAGRVGRVTAGDSSVLAPAAKRPAEAEREAESGVPLPDKTKLAQLDALLDNDDVLL